MKHLSKKIEDLACLYARGQAGNSPTAEIVQHFTSGARALYSLFNPVGKELTFSRDVHTQINIIADDYASKSELPSTDRRNLAFKDGARAGYDLAFKDLSKSHNREIVLLRGLQDIIAAAGNPEITSDKCRTIIERANQAINLVSEG